MHLYTSCCEVWDLFCEKHSKRPQRLENIATRIITSNDVDHPILTFKWAKQGIS